MRLDRLYRAVPLLTLTLLLGSAEWSFAQDEDWELTWEAGGSGSFAEKPGGLPGTSSAMSGGATHNWLTPYNDDDLRCRMWVRGRPGVLIYVTVTILTPDGEYGNSSSGVGIASVIARMPSIYNHSPGEYVCHGSYTTVGAGAGRSEITARSAGFWGRYVRLAWDYDVIEYVLADCLFPGLWDQVQMVNPAPGYPNVANPPEYMADVGFRFTAQGTASPMFINFYGPRSSLPQCIPPQ